MTEEQQDNLVDSQAAPDEIPKTQDRVPTRRPNIFVRFWQWLRGINLNRLNRRLFWAYYILLLVGLVLFCISVIYNLSQDIENFFWLFVILIYSAVLSLLRLISYFLIRFLPPALRRRRERRMGGEGEAIQNTVINNPPQPDDNIT